MDLWHSVIVSFRVSNRILPAASCFQAIAIHFRLRAADFPRYAADFPPVFPVARFMWYKKHGRLVQQVIDHVTWVRSVFTLVTARIRSKAEFSRQSPVVTGQVVCRTSEITTKFRKWNFSQWRNSLILCEIKIDEQSNSGMYRAQFMESASSLSAGRIRSSDLR